MFKKLIKIPALVLVLTLVLTTSAFAMPVDQDPLEPVNNAYQTTYTMSQNTWFSYIQYSNDFDFINFVAPKTVSQQDIWLLPPYGKNYAIGVYEYGSGSPIAYSQSYGNMVTLKANLVAGKKYTILVFPADGSFDVDNYYIIGLPNLF